MNESMTSVRIRERLVEALKLDLVGPGVQLGETGLRIYKELACMKKEHVDIANQVVFIEDSKNPTGVAEVPLTDLAATAFKDQLGLAGSGSWLFRSPDSPNEHQ